MEVATVAARTRKRPQARAAGRQSAPKLKTTVHFGVEASERLAIHALKAGMDRSEFLEALIMAHCRRWVISDRGGDRPPVEVTDRHEMIA